MSSPPLPSTEPFGLDPTLSPPAPPLDFDNSAVLDDCCEPTDDDLIARQCKKFDAISGFTHEGYLYKQGQHGVGTRTLTKIIQGGLYKRRWLKLDVVKEKKLQKQLGLTATLLYYESHNSIKKNGEIDVQSITQVDTEKNDGPSEFSLNITTKTRVWKFSCDSEVERQVWKSALEKLLNMLSISSVLSVIHDVPPLPPLPVSPSTLEFLHTALKLQNVRAKAEREERALLSEGVLSSNAEFVSFGAVSSEMRSTPLTQPTGVSGNEVMKVETLVKEALLAEPSYHALLDEVMKEHGLDRWRKVTVNGQQVYGENKYFAEDGNTEPLGKVVGSGKTTIPPKSKEWCVQRASTAYNNEMRRVVDVLKTIIVLDEEATLVSVARFIMSRWRVVRMNNTFRSPAFTGQRDLTLNVAIPLPSASVLRKESKKKFHIVEINLQLSGFLNLKEEAHVPYLYFKDLSDLRFLGPSVSSFFDDMEDGENIADYLQRIIKSDNWSALENLDDMVGIRMMADWEVKIRTSRRLVELAEGHHSETTLLGRAHEFANACENMNMESDAIAIYEKVIQARDRIFGDKDRDIMLAVDRMAGMYRSKGELDTALDMYQDAVKKLQAVMKDERRDFATKLEQCKLEGEKNLERLKLEDEKNLASALEEAKKSEEASLEKAKKRSDANVVLLKTGLEARLKDEVARVREGGEMKLEDALRELDDRLHKEKEAATINIGNFAFYRVGESKIRNYTPCVENVFTKWLLFLRNSTIRAK
ncbi:hypothetical protein TrCOL_g112 [Triparma columacea]|uniref:PH domain-containing protein n=1 Tax=Triparma columacea TaxID=722753 RepID=A0A9W7GGH7_9STRA|nr:hypothetical protein TrCOL_g112 [Triparma columacea]